MYRLREERDIEPETMANLVSSSLYEKRFGPYFVSPVIAGLNQRTGKPFICGFDSIGYVLLLYHDAGAGAGGGCDGGQRTRFGWISTRQCGG